MNALALTFQETHFDVVDRNGQPWLQAAQIAKALGYSNDNAVSRIYARNSDEFTDNMTGKVKLTLSGNLETEVRIFSLRGCHLLAMFARTKVAKEFRKWVLDVLDSLTPAPAPKCAIKALPKKSKVELPGCISLSQQEALNALIHARADTIENPQKRGTAIAGMWTNLNNKMGTRGMKDGYKNIPAEQFRKPCRWWPASRCRASLFLPVSGCPPSRRFTTTPARCWNRRISSGPNTALPPVYTCPCW